MLSPMKTPGVPNHIASLSAAYRRRFPGRPAALDIELTDRCNLRCPSCWFHGEHGVGDRFAGQELTTEEAFALIDRLAPSKLSLYFGGGEPLLRGDFLDILARARSHGLRTAFTTNGTLLTAEVAARLVELQVSAINVSVDGPEDVHDRLRGPGAFRRAVAGLIGLLDARGRKGAAVPAVTANITVNPGVAGRLEETVALLRELCEGRIDKYRIHHLWFITPRELAAHQAAVERVLGCSAAGAAAHLLPSSGAIPLEELAGELSRLRGVPGVIFFPDLEGSALIDFYTERARPAGNCRASSRSLVIKPDGSVVFCPDEWIDGYVLGNIRETSLAGLWRGARAKHFRKAIRREGAFPGCRRCSWLG
jgi:radical SAM protein with 4Fe4S-binding SPASM domain